MAQHIYSPEVGSIRHERLVTVITTKHLFLHFVHSRATYILTMQE